MEGVALLLVPRVLKDCLVVGVAIVRVPRLLKGCLVVPRLEESGGELREARLPERNAFLLLCVCARVCVCTVILSSTR